MWGSSGGLCWSSTYKGGDWLKIKLKLQSQGLKADEPGIGAELPCLPGRHWWPLGTQRWDSLRPLRRGLWTLTSMMSPWRDREQKWGKSEVLHVSRHKSEYLFLIHTLWRTSFLKCLSFWAAALMCLYVNISIKYYHIDRQYYLDIVICQEKSTFYKMLSQMVFDCEWLQQVFMLF